MVILAADGRYGSRFVCVCVCVCVWVWVRVLLHVPEVFGTVSAKIAPRIYYKML